MPKHKALGSSPQHQKPQTIQQPRIFVCFLKGSNSVHRIPLTHSPLAFASQVLGLQPCAITSIFAYALQCVYYVCACLCTLVWVVCMFMSAYSYGSQRRASAAFPHALFTLPLRWHLSLAQQAPGSCLPVALLEAGMPCWLFFLLFMSLGD